MNRHTFSRLVASLTLSLLAPACAPSASDPQITTPEVTTKQSSLTRSGATIGRTIAAGYSHACMIGGGGKVYCWGDNSIGQVGLSSLSAYVKPTELSVNGAISISAGAYHTCALLANGTVKCWGQGTDGKLGINSFANSQPATVITAPGSPLQDVVDVSAGGSHTCALLADGTAKCWGQGGLLGNGSTTGSKVPVSVSGLSDLREIVAGGSHTCARTATGQAYCWGGQGSGQLGNGLTTGYATSPVAVLGLDSVVQISAGSGHTCAVRRAEGDSSRTYCWGSNGQKQLGMAATGSSSAVPVLVRWDLVPSALDVVSVSAGYGHSCARLTSGETTCWGDNTSKQAGVNSTKTTISYPQSTVERIAGTSLSGVTEVSLGGYFSCASTGLGEGYCWGSDDQGKRGDGPLGGPAITYLATKMDLSVGVRVSNNPVFTGALKHSCILTPAGEVKCSGDNSWAQLGNGTWTSSTTPVSVLSASGSTTPLSGVVQLDAHASHSCALLADGGVRCWGRGDSGQNGNGVRTHALTPVAPVGLDGSTLKSVSVVSGGSHGCALLSDGKVKCWGANTYGELGSGDPLDVFPSPRDVKYADGTLLSGVKQIAGGQLHSCAITTDGKVRCWGFNSRGEVGNGAPCREVPNPITVQYAGSDLIAAEVVTGSEHTCARQASGRVLCWGYNSHGPLGDGTINSSAVPVEAMASGAVALVAGDYHTCAIKSDGTMHCWGYNADGQIGDGTTTDKLSPTPVSGLPAGVYPVSMGASDGYTCVILSDNSTRCFGKNDFGQFGNGTTTNSLTPVAAAPL